MAYHLEKKRKKRKKGSSENKGMLKKDNLKLKIERDANSITKSK